MQQKLWFMAKKYGWGWTPVTWQGWAITGVFVLFSFWNFQGVDKEKNPEVLFITPYLLREALAVIVILLVCMIKGEKPRWRWGK